MDAVLIWDGLAGASLEARRYEEAVRWFERLGASRSERLLHPIPYVRSFYLLGQLYERRGEPDRAADS